MAALLPILLSLAQLVPVLLPQIEKWVELFQQKGHFTLEQEAEINTLWVTVHAEVKRLIDARTNP